MSSFDRGSLFHLDLPLFFQSIFPQDWEMYHFEDDFVDDSEEELGIKKRRNEHTCMLDEWNAGVDSDDEDGAVSAGRKKPKVNNL